MQKKVKQTLMLFALFHPIEGMENVTNAPWRPGENNEERRSENEKRAQTAAENLFPGEKWEKADIGERIFRSSRRSITTDSYEGELRDAQILRDLGSAVYLLPEKRTVPNEKKYDAIVDGFKMEFKNMSGSNENTLITHFYRSRRQAPNVFINLDGSPLSKHKIISILHGARTGPKYDTKDEFPQGGTMILKISGHRDILYFDINKPDEW